MPRPTTNHLKARFEEACAVPSSSPAYAALYTRYMAHAQDLLDAGVLPENVPVAAAFLAQFEMARPHQLFYTPADAAAGYKVPDGLRPDGTQRFCYKARPAEYLTAQCRGMVGRLNGSEAYRRVQAVSSNGIYSPAKSSEDAPHWYGAVTIEADSTLLGEDLPRVKELSVAATLGALAPVRELLGAMGVANLLNCIMFSGGKSTHVHFVVQPTQAADLHGYLTYILGALCTSAYAKVGLAIDPAPLSPKQAVRIPVGEYLGRDQAVVEFAGAGNNPTVVDALNALCPVRYPGDEREAEQIKAVADKIIAFITTHLAADAMLDASLRARARAKPGQSTKALWQTVFAKGAGDLFTWLRTTLVAIDARFDDRPVRTSAGRILETSAPRAAGGLRKAAKAKTARLNDTDSAQATYSTMRGELRFTHPVDFDMRTRTNAAWAPACETVDAGSLAAAAALEAMCSGVTPPKVQVARFSEDGLEDQTPSAWMRWDTARGNYVYYNDQAGTAQNIVAPIGRPILEQRAWPVESFNASWTPTKGTINFMTLRPGGGKTTRMIEVIKERVAADPTYRVLWIAPNVSLTSKMCADLAEVGVPSRLYSDRTGESTIYAPYGAVVITTLHSLRRLSDTDEVSLALTGKRRIDMVVFDEFGTGMRMLETMGSDLWARGETQARECMARLIDAMKHASEVVFMEATPTAADVVVVERLAAETGKGLRVVTADATEKVWGAGHDRDGNKRKVVLMNEGAGAYADVAAAIRSGKRVLFQQANYKTAVALFRHLQATFPEAEGLCVNKDTTKHPDVVAITAGHGAAASRYQYVIATTSLAAGVSFVNQFDVVYVWHGPHVAAPMLAQATCRDRTAPRIVVVRTAPKARPGAMITGDRLPDAIDTFSFMRRAIMLQKQATVHSWWVLEHWLRTEQFEIIKGSDALTEALDFAQVPTVRAKGERLDLVDAQRRVRVAENKQLMKALRATPKISATELADSAALRIGHATVRRVDNLMNATTVEVPVDHRALDAVITTINHYKRTAKVFLAEDGWRWMARHLHGGVDVSTMQEREWHACVQLLDHLTGLSPMDLAGPVFEATRLALEPQAAFGDDSIYTIAKVGRTVYERAVKALVTNTRARNCGGAYDIKLQDLLESIGITVNPDGFLAALLSKILGAPVKVRHSKRSPNIIIDMEAGACILATGTIGMSLTYAQGRYVDDLLQQHADSKGHILAPVTILATTAQDARRANPLNAKQIKLLAGAKAALAGWKRVVRHKVIEFSGATTWANGTPAVVTRARVNKRKDKGEALLLPNEATSAAVFHPSISDDVTITSGALMPRINAFDMRVGAWVPMRFNSLKALNVARAELARLTRTKRLNRHVVANAIGGTLHVERWAHAPPPDPVN